MKANVKIAIAVPLNPVFTQKFAASSVLSRFLVSRIQKMRNLPARTGLLFGDILRN